jgi:Tfp pilus assembly protein PilN
MSINLLPPQIKKEKETSRKFITVFGYSFFLLILLSATGGGIYLYNQKLDKKATDLNKKYDQFAAEDKQYDQTANEINIINQKLVKIDGVNKNRIVWSLILTNLARSTPSGVQIKTLDLSKDAKNASITGEAASRMEIARFKEKLENNDYFKNVVFSSSTVNERESNFTFNMTAELEKIN